MIRVNYRQLGESEPHRVHRRAQPGAIGRNPQWIRPSHHHHVIGCSLTTPGGQPDGGRSSCACLRSIEINLTSRKEARKAVFFRCTNIQSNSKLPKRLSQPCDRDVRPAPSVCVPARRGQSRDIQPGVEKIAVPVWNQTSQWLLPRHVFISRKAGPRFCVQRAPHDPSFVLRWRCQPRSIAGFLPMAGSFSSSRINKSIMRSIVSG